MLLRFSWNTWLWLRSSVLLHHRGKERIASEYDVEDSERYGYPSFEVGKRNVLILDGFVFLLAVVTAYPPLMFEQRNRKLLLKLMNDSELRCVQVFVGINE